MNYKNILFIDVGLHSVFSDFHSVMKNYINPSFKSANITATTAAGLF